MPTRKKYLTLSLFPGLLLLTSCGNNSSDKTSSLLATQQLLSADTSKNENGSLINDINKIAGKV